MILFVNILTNKSHNFKISSVCDFSLYWYSLLESDLSPKTFTGVYLLGAAEQVLEYETI